MSPPPQARTQAIPAPPALPAWWPWSTHASGSASRLVTVAAPLLAAPFLAALGLWTSFHHTFTAWGVDGDTASPVMLWSGWQAQGWPFIRSWAFTPDNWLLSLVPLDFVAFALFGTHPALVVGSGWVIFLGCTGLAGLLAARLAGWGTARWLLALLLLANPAVLGPTGFMAYPVTHNISVLWGLVSLYAALRWVGGAGPVWLPLCAAAVVVNAASDPWATAAFTLPLLLAPLALLPLPSSRGRRGALAALLLVVLAAAAVVESRVFGLLGFVRDAAFVRTDWPGMNANFALLGHVAATVFGIFPGQHHPYPITTVLTLGLLGGLVAAALHATLRGLGRAGIELRFLLLAGWLSCGGVAAAFVLGEFPRGMFVGRFFLNVYVLLPLLLACAASRLPVVPGFRRALAGYAALMMLTGLGTDAAAWRRPVRINTSGAAELAGFLERNGLRYGYGAYWATQANAVSWLADGRVLIRAVTFHPRTGRISPRPDQTSATWYEPGDRPAEARDTFVVIRRDEENCADLTLCRAGVTAQLGQPVRELAYGDALILVWTGSVLDRLDRP